MNEHTMLSNLKEILVAGEDPEGVRVHPVGHDDV